MNLYRPTAPDTDGEFIPGTSITDPDSGCDGILDGAEVRQCTDPLENTPARTTIIALLDTRDTALNIGDLNDVAAVMGRRN